MDRLKKLKARFQRFTRRTHAESSDPPPETSSKSIPQLKKKKSAIFFWRDDPPTPTADPANHLLPATETTTTNQRLILPSFAFERSTSDSSWASELDKPLIDAEAQLTIPDAVQATPENDDKTSVYSTRPVAERYTRVVPEAPALDASWLEALQNFAQAPVDSSPAPSEKTFPASIPLHLHESIEIRKESDVESANEKLPGTLPEDTSASPSTSNISDKVEPALGHNKPVLITDHDSGTVVVRPVDGHSQMYRVAKRPRDSHSQHASILDYFEHPRSTSEAGSLPDSINSHISAADATQDDLTNDHCSLPPTTSPLFRAAKCVADPRSLSRRSVRSSRYARSERLTATPLQKKPSLLYSLGRRCKSTSDLTRPPRIATHSERPTLRTLRAENNRYVRHPWSRRAWISRMHQWIGRIEEVRTPHEDDLRPARPLDAQPAPAEQQEQHVSLNTAGRDTPDLPQTTSTPQWSARNSLDAEPAQAEQQEQGVSPNTARRHTTNIPRKPCTAHWSSRKSLDALLLQAQQQLQQISRDNAKRYKIHPLSRPSTHPLQHHPRTMSMCQDSHTGPQRIYSSNSHAISAAVAAIRAYSHAGRPQTYVQAHAPAHWRTAWSSPRPVAQEHRRRFNACTGSSLKSASPSSVVGRAVSGPPAATFEQVDQMIGAASEEVQELARSVQQGPDTEDVESLRRHWRAHVVAGRER